MDRLKNQIKESFFNPLLYVFPILIFIIGDYFFDTLYVYIAASVAVIISILYVKYSYPRIFKWFLLFSVVFWVPFFIFDSLLLGVDFYYIADIRHEIALLLSLVLLLLFRRKLSKATYKLIPRLLPMANNIMEYYKLVQIFIYLLVGFLFLYSVFRIVDNSQTGKYIDILFLLYAALAAVVILYEIIRVYMARKNLRKERWLPIVSDDGNVIGNIHEAYSYLDTVKFTHPVVRGIYIQDNKILLQKPLPNEFILKPKWDSFINNHIHMDETAEVSIQRTAAEFYGITDLTTFFLTKYMLETNYEIQYSMVFIVCKFAGEITPDSTQIEQVKWWTLPQIEDNIAEGTFTEQFIKEYELLKRSGLISSEEEEDMDLSEMEMDF